MQVHSLVNSSALAKQVAISFPAADLAENSQPSARSKAMRVSAPRTTTGTFITPQSLMAFPFASGLVAGIWQATNALGLHDHNYIGFLISLFVGAVVYGITITDPRLKTPRKERIVALGIGVINCFYLIYGRFGPSPGFALFPRPLVVASAEGTLPQCPMRFDYLMELNFTHFPFVLRDFTRFA